MAKKSDKPTAREQLVEKKPSAKLAAIVGEGPICGYDARKKILKHAAEKRIDCQEFKDLGIEDLDPAKLCDVVMDNLEKIPAAK